jgi:hypothetical protein
MNINPQMIQQFLQFRQNFTGDAKAQVQRMLNSGQISQAQYDNAVKTAQQLQQMLSSSVRR